jgi:hypothetical protein
MFKGHQRRPTRAVAVQVWHSKLKMHMSLPKTTFFAFLVDTDNEISKRKLQDVTETAALEVQEEVEEAIEPSQPIEEEIETESIGDEIEFIEKPERQDIEKKLE